MKRSSISSPGPPCASRPKPQGHFVPPEQQDAVFVSMAAPQAGFDDVEFLPDYWDD